jgi:CheY-like chemotaxis protein
MRVAFPGAAAWPAMLSLPARDGQRERLLTQTGEDAPSGRCQATDIRLAVWQEGRTLAEVFRPSRILVVDDNHLILKLLHLILEGGGYLPVAVESGALALEIVNEAAPDLCLVDEVMPGMRGSELIRALRASGDPRIARVPVIGISARAGAARELLAAGANAVVPKPIEEGAILAAVAALIGPPRRDEAGLPA